MSSAGLDLPDSTFDICHCNGSFQQIRKKHNSTIRIQTPLFYCAFHHTGERPVSLSRAPPAPSKLPFHMSTHPLYLQQCIESNKRWTFLKWLYSIVDSHSLKQVCIESAFFKEFVMQEQVVILAGYIKWINTIVLYINFATTGLSTFTAYPQLQLILRGSLSQNFKKRNTGAVNTAREKVWQLLPIDWMRCQKYIEVEDACPNI